MATAALKHQGCPDPQGRLQQELASKLQGLFQGKPPAPTVWGALHTHRLQAPGRSFRSHPAAEHSEGA